MGRSSLCGLVDKAARSLLLARGAYVAAQMMTDTASLRIISVGRFSVDAGTLIYPFTFTLRDLVPKIGGRSAAYTLALRRIQEAVSAHGTRDYFQSTSD